MKQRIKVVAATFLATSLLAAFGAAPAAAQQQQDGLINVAIGDITIEDVNIGVAALIVANVCGVQVGPVVLLAQQVDATGVQRTVCEAEAGDVVLTQN